MPVLSRLNTAEKSDTKHAQGKQTEQRKYSKWREGRKVNLAILQAGKKKIAKKKSELVILQD